MEQEAGAWCRLDTLNFRLRDPARRLAGVRLVQHAGLPADRLDFEYAGTDRAWRLSLPRPPLWRLEYMLELHHADGGIELICDPDNPRRVGGTFGDKSVVECPDYVEPAWLRQPGASGSWRECTIPAPALRCAMRARIWSPAAAGRPTDRILVAHDGPEYDGLAALGHYSAAMILARRVAPHHLVLLAPDDRNEWYSASPAYALALATEVLPWIGTALGSTRPPIGMGVSLGGLAMLHAQRQYPETFSGLFLQSGSFFRPRHDRHESGFPRYGRIVRFTGRVGRVGRGGWVGPGGRAGPGGAAAPTVPIVLTCGQVEENLANNREMAQALRTEGCDVRLCEVPDGHNYTGWRDAFDPCLTDLLRRVWSSRWVGDP